MKPSRTELCNCFAVRQAARHITRLYEQEMASAELTSAQFSILLLLDESHGLTLAELAESMVMDRTTLLRAVKPLEREGLVKSRNQDQAVGDSRSRVVEITSDGEARLTMAIGLWTVVQRKFEAAVGPDRAARLRKDLSAITAV
jgi:DNA-binding MarR family transcriptional regulator